MQHTLCLGPERCAVSVCRIVIRYAVHPYIVTPPVLCVCAGVEQVVRAVIGSPVLLMQAGISPRHEDGKQLMAVKARALAALMAGITTDMHEVAGMPYTSIMYI